MHATKIKVQKVQNGFAHPLDLSLFRLLSKIGTLSHIYENKVYVWKRLNSYI